MLTRIALVASLALGSVLGACTNDPYPYSDRDSKVLYSSFSEAPKTLDPAVSYTTAEYVITGNVYDTLLEYHYLKRPYQLMPGLAEAVPQSEPLADGGERYDFQIEKWGWDADAEARRKQREGEMRAASRIIALEADGTQIE